MAYAAELGVGEDGVGDEAVGGCEARESGGEEVAFQDAAVVEGDVGELGSAFDVA